ncbi:MAG: glycosyltransferase involved in cell wall biosynthesis, partial [Verrucomicrobiales bacterium]
MPSSPRPTLLVIPAFRESRRLPKFLPELCEAVAGLDGDSLAIRVVDDGSGSAEQKVVRDLVAELRERHAFLQEPLILERNLGKGGAVYAGWDASQGEGFAHIGFVDADGAVSASEVARVVQQIPGLEAGECLYAARLHDDDQSIKRTLIRKWLGLLFRR